MSRTQSSGYQANLTQEIDSTREFLGIKKDEIFPGIENDDAFLDDEQDDVARYFIYPNLAEKPLTKALVSEDLENYDMFVGFLLHLQSEGRSAEVLSQMPQIFQSLIKNRKDISFAKGFFDIMFSHGHGDEAIAATIKAYEEGDNVAKENAGQMLTFLSEKKGRKISKSFLEGRAALSYCASDKTRSSLIQYFQSLNQPIIAPEYQQLFNAAENADIAVLRWNLELLHNQQRDFVYIIDEYGRNIFDTAFASAYFIQNDQNKRATAQVAEVLFTEIEQKYPQNYGKIIENITVNGGNIIQLFAEHDFSECLELMMRNGYCDLSKVRNYKFPYLFEVYTKSVLNLQFTAELQFELQKKELSLERISSLIQAGAFLDASDIAKNGQKQPTLYAALIFRLLEDKSPDQKKAEAVIKILGMLEKKGRFASNQTVLQKVLEQQNYTLAVYVMVAQGKFSMPLTDNKMQEAVALVRENKTQLMQAAPDNVIKKIAQEFLQGKPKPEEVAIQKQYSGVLSAAKAWESRNSDNFGERRRAPSSNDKKSAPLPQLFTRSVPFSGQFSLEKENKKGVKDLIARFSPPSSPSPQVKAFSVSNFGAVNPKNYVVQR